MNSNEQPGWPQQPNNQGQPQDGPPYPPIPPAPGHGGQHPFPPYTEQPGQQPYGDTGQQPFGEAGQQFGQAPMFTQAPARTGMPVWGWAAGGVGVAAVIAVAGVMIFNGLSGGKTPEVLPSPNSTESASTEQPVDEESADAVASEASTGSVYLFEDADFSKAPVWSIQEPEGWTKEPVKNGMVNYRNAGLQCTFTVHQAVMQGAAGTGDEAATAVAMASEIAGVEKAVGRPVDVVDDAGSVYVALRDGSEDIELQEAELRFKNDNQVDVVYRMALRATTGSSGLMELALACPGDLDTELELWMDLTDSVTMVDAA